MEELLSKEEILARSQQENKNGDEMEKTVRIQGESFSLIFVFAVGLALTSYKLWRGLPVGDILAMFWACSLGCSLYKAVNLRQKSQAGIAIFCLVMVVWNLVRYIPQGW